jgi:hypothetical protein
MATSIYRIGTDIYDGATNQRISGTDWSSGKYKGATELGTVKAGSQLIKAPSEISKYDVTGKIGGSLFGTLKQSTLPANQINASTISTGINTGNIAATLPNSNNLSQQVYNQNLLAESQNNVTTLQNQLNNIQSTQLKEAATQKQQAEADLAKLQSDKQAEITNYDSKMAPIVDKARTQYNSMLGSLEQINYNDLVKQKLDLTNQVIDYSKLMRSELDASAANPSLTSVIQGRTSAIKENYTSKIATAQAAMQAIDGNFTLAFDIMEKGANAINQTTNDRINFLNQVNSLYNTNISDAKTKVSGLSADQQKLIEGAITDLKAKIANVNKSKEEIAKLMETSPIVAQKAGLSLTDTPEQRAQKLQTFYNKNQQYLPENQDYIKKAMEKYYDAGITLNDTLATVKSKIMMSKVYEKDVAGKFSLSVDPTTGENKIFNSVTGDITVVPASGTVGGQCGDYLHKILDGLPAVGDTVASKKAAMNLTPEQFRTAPQVGDVLAFNIGEHGHVAVVTAVNGDQVTINESNYGLDERIGNRTININDPKIVGAYRGANFKNNAPVVNEGAKSWAKLINEGKVKINEVPEKIRQSVINEMANSGTVSKTDAKATEEAQGKINLINDIINGVSNSGAIGPNPLARTSLSSWITGTRQTLVGNIKQLTSQETLDRLINLKKAGGTLGALSDQERVMLQNAATKIGSWEMKDKNGNGTGFYNVSESSFIEELKNIKKLAEKAVKEAKGENGVINSLEQNLSANPAKIDEYNKLVKDNPNLSEDEINQLLGF